MTLTHLLLVLMVLGMTSTQSHAEYINGKITMAKRAIPIHRRHLT